MKMLAELFSHMFGNEPPALVAPLAGQASLAKL
jgi:hypothetical protein